MVPESSVSPVIQVMEALAQAQGAPTGAACTQMAMMMVVIFAIFYFIVLRPQRKEQEKQQAFLDRLKEGDRVITTSGILGRIVTIDQKVATLDVGDRTKIRFLRNQIARLQDDEPEKGEKTASAEANPEARPSGDAARKGGKKQRD